MERVLLLEDDESIRRGVAFQLEKEGYSVDACRTVAEAEEIFHHKEIQLMICDVTLPDGNGMDLVRRIRGESSMHIIFLTALDQVMGY